MNSRRASTSASHVEWSFPKCSNSQKRRSRFGFKTDAQSGSANSPQKWSTHLRLKGISSPLTLSIMGLNITSTIPWLMLAAFSHPPSQYFTAQCIQLPRTNRLVAATQLLRQILPLRFDCDRLKKELVNSDFK